MHQMKSASLRDVADFHIRRLHRQHGECQCILFRNSMGHESKRKNVRMTSIGICIINHTIGIIQGSHELKGSFRYWLGSTNRKKLFAKSLVYSRQGFSLHIFITISKKHMEAFFILFIDEAFTLKLGPFSCFRHHLEILSLKYPANHGKICCPITSP